MLTINKDGIAITERFFQAIELLKMQRKIRGLQTYTREYNINRWNLVSTRNKPDRSVLKPEYLVPLVRDFGVSAEWLLTGRGAIFKY
ncbi:MAG: hypothetical protein J6P44_02140 [Bacteroidales bacterium]|nr:hypothetical protein [Bacteroidales bacterium]MBQ9253283.1 hypothetical protein [Bacteroidales bacterium]